jgi:hypothetical protein
MTASTLPDSSESDTQNADAVAAEVLRLKSPELAYAKSPPHLTIIGKRIDEERLHGNAWIKTNLSREQRRRLSITSTFGPLDAAHLWEDEPPLKYEDWDDLIASEARKLVIRRKETGCPTFELWQRYSPSERASRERAEALFHELAAKHRRMGVDRAIDLVRKQLLEEGHAPYWLRDEIVV